MNDSSVSSVYVLFKQGRCVGVSTDADDLVSDLDTLWYSRHDDSNAWISHKFPDFQLVRLNGVRFTLKTNECEFRELTESN